MKSIKYKRPRTARLLSLLAFAAAQKQWSEKTFGTREQRGFKGPLKHLKKELKEIKKKPDDIMEWVDAFFLLLDGLWRAGFTTRQLMTAAWKKLHINQHEREWPAIEDQDPNGATEHKR